MQGDGEINALFSGIKGEQIPTGGGGLTTTAKPVRRRRRKKQSPSALARSRKRHARFLPDLSINEQAILCKFLATVNIDSDDSDEDLRSVLSVCSNFNRPPEKGDELKRCSRCHITRYHGYCSVQCQRKDWDLHRFACSAVYCVILN